MLAAVFFWAGREHQPVGHHRVKHRPLITICLTAIVDLSLKKPLVKPDLAALCFNMTSLFLV
jgi:hypothetical protein